MNAAEDQLQEALKKNDTSKIINLGTALKFNGGGHINHTILWKNLTSASTTRSGELDKAIETSFGNFENFKKKLTATTVGIQGSGWGWLGYNKETKRLQIASCANQDPLEATTGLSWRLFLNSH